MNYAHTLSVGIVLVIALCGQAIATDLPTPESLVTLTDTEVPAFTLRSAPPVYQMSVAPDIKEQNLKLVHSVASEVGHQEVLQAMLLQESNGGVITSLVGNLRSSVAKRSYGLMQVQIVAARSVLRQYPQLMDDYFAGRNINRVSDRELIKLLLMNPVANIRVAAYHFNLYYRLVGCNRDRAIAAYNVGIGGVKKLKNPARYKYVIEVKHKMNTVVKPFNTLYGLDSTAVVVPTQQQKGESHGF